MTPRSQLRSDDGFTLPELLIVIVVMSFIVPAMVAVIFLTFSNATDTSNRVRDSSSAQTASAYFASDAQGAETVAPGGTTCMGSAPAGHAYTSVVQFEWKDPTDASTLVTKDSVYFVDRYTNADGVTVRALRRSYCEAGSQQSNLTLVGALDTSTPSVACDTACTGSPTTVTLSAVTQTGFSFSLSGTRRAS